VKVPEVKYRVNARSFDASLSGIYLEVTQFSLFRRMVRADVLCHCFGRLGVAFVVCGLWHTNSLANGASCPGTSSRDLELGFMGSVQLGILYTSLCYLSSIVGLLRSELRPEEAETNGVETIMERLEGNSVTVLIFRDVVTNP